jgi:iron complex outermembrane receptor protein
MMIMPPLDYSFAHADRSQLAPLRRGLLCTGVALTALLVAAPAAAQDAAPTDTPAPTNTVAATAAVEGPASGDIIVTAQRREENIRKVPISVTSYSQQLMDRQGIRQIEDIARLTPSLRFTRTAGVAGNNGANISIRGIASDVGSATTAIYIDDTPIQIRSIGYFSGNPYPRIFDLDRVEVLRGPQGTLFGAGAEGGAVRFLTPQPSFTKFGLYARSEVSTTEHGAESFEGGFAVGGPASETLAVQASAWYRRDGGYVDRINPTTLVRTDKDINQQDTMAMKLAVSWRPVEELTITPSVYYQNIESDGRDQFWQNQSNLKKTDYVSGISNAEPSRDRFVLPALKVEYDFGKIALISNSSYFDRTQHQVLDYTNYLSALRSGNPFGTYANKQASNATATQSVQQRNFTQEVRLQSVDPDSFFDWTIGGYYAKAKQHFTNLSASGRIPGVISGGFPQYLGRYNLLDDIHAVDKQIAGFASVDLKPADGLKITLAARVTKSKFDFMNLRDGPTNSGLRTITNAQQKDTSFTPKIGISYQVDENNLIYASASKGFRQGGAQSPVDPNFCASDLKTLGLTASPTAYDSDSLWSYEAGIKNKVLGGKVLIDVNAYLIKWKNIQQSIRLPTCNFSFISNLGNATSKGTDVSVAFNPVEGLQVGANVGFNKTTYDDPVLGGNGLLLRAKGDRIGGPKWNGSVFGQIDHDVTESAAGYFRADYSFASSGIDPTPGTFGYDQNLPGIGGTNYLTLRTGVRFSGVDLSAFVNNVTNSHDFLSRSHDTIASTLYYAETFRPRTYGLTLQYRY